MTPALRLRPASFALAAALAAAALRASAVEDGDRQVRIAPDTLFRGVSIPSAFRGLDGRTQPPGLYDLKLHQGTQGILIGLVKNGRTVAEVKGRYVNGFVSRFSAGGRASAPAQDIHFDASGKVGFEGAGKGKISCSNDRHPGGANLGFISFELPAGQSSGK